MTEPNDLIKERRKKLESIKAMGIDPFGGKFSKGHMIRALLENFEDKKRVNTAGRLSAMRLMGKTTFCDLKDDSGRIQLYMKHEHLGEEQAKLFECLDIGDIIGVEGELFKTKTGEISVRVDKLRLLSKSLRPLPEKWHGLKDVEVRYRQRYLDLISNEESREIFKKRSLIIRSIRKILDDKGYLEVETPMMHAIPGGAAGEPFITHHQTLDVELYLRLAPELYLKKLLVGGLERVYELNRSFRNEGVSTQHNPEFTMLEAYAAYQDCAYMMELVQELICEAAKTLLGKLQCEFQGQAIDLSPPWDRVSFAQAMEAMGLSPSSSLEDIQRVLERKGMNVKELNRSQLVRLIEQLFSPKTKTKPLFVVDYWTELSPLAKAKPDEPLIADRFELFIGGMEVANAYSELNDPIEQRRRFEAQLEEGTGHGARGSKSSSRPPPRARQIDEAFLEALEYGMPPAGGLGVGIDRLAMVLLNQPSIKDVILFPLLKPEV